MQAVTFARRALSTPLVLHPASIAVGALACGVLFLSMSQGGTLQAPMPLRVEYMPHPRDIVKIENGTQFTVPAGKIFTLMGGGGRGLQGLSGVYFGVAGTVEWESAIGGPYVQTAGPGMVYGPGTVLAASGMAPYSQQNVYIIGYLAAQ